MYVCRETNWAKVLDTLIERNIEKQDKLGSLFNYSSVAHGVATLLRQMTTTSIEYVCMYVCMYLCMYVCMYVCMSTITIQSQRWLCSFNE